MQQQASNSIKTIETPCSLSLSLSHPLVLSIVNEWSFVVCYLFAGGCVIEYVTYTLFINHKLNWFCFSWAPCVFSRRAWLMCFTLYFFSNNFSQLPCKNYIKAHIHMKFTLFMWSMSLNDFHYCKHSFFFIHFIRSVSMSFPFFSFSNESIYTSTIFTNWVQRKFKCNTIWYLMSDRCFVRFYFYVDSSVMR